MRHYNQGVRWIYYCLLVFNSIYVMMIAILYRCRCSTYEDNAKGQLIRIIFLLIWLYVWAVGGIAVSSVTIQSINEYHSMLDQTGYQKNFDIIENCVQGENELISEAIASAFQEK